MSEQLASLEAQWRDALKQEDAPQLERVVRDVLQQHPESTLAAQIRYQRGVITLMEGEGRGSERLAKAMSEFELGMSAGEAVGAESEPWRSLNKTQLATCKARLGNIEEAISDLKGVIQYRPRTVAGVGAMHTLARVLRENGKEREATRYQTQRISYARALVRESTEADEATQNELRLVLANELLDSNFAKEGQKMLQELKAMGEEALGAEMYADVIQSLELIEGS